MKFFRRGKPLRGGEKTPEPPGGQVGLTSYDEKMDEVTRWNIEHTDILEILRREIREERLISWSNALHIGIRKVLKKPGYARGTPEYDALRDLDQFIAKQRIKLLGNPSTRDARGIEKMDSLSVCIVCGIRALQQKKGLPGAMNTLKMKLLERYLG